MKEAVSSPAVASCAGKLFVIGGGPDDDTCSDKVGNRQTPSHPPCQNHTLKHKVMTAEGLSQLVLGNYTLWKMFKIRRRFRMNPFLSKQILNYTLESIQLIRRVTFCEPVVSSLLGCVVGWIDAL